MVLEPLPNEHASRSNRTGIRTVVPARRHRGERRGRAAPHVTQADGLAAIMRRYRDTLHK
jgi:hypothetical protein